MRVVATVLLALFFLGGASTAQAQIPICQQNASLCQTLKIVNNSPTDGTGTTIYPVIFLGDQPVDDWLIAQFQITDPSVGNARLVYPRTNVFLYIGVSGSGNNMVPVGVPAGYTALVTLPFYSQMVQTPVINSDAGSNNYIDWWNGGRVVFFDIPDQVNADFKTDLPYLATPFGGTSNNPCVVVFQTGTTPPPCTAAPIFAKIGAPQAGGVPSFPETDKLQLTEYTLGAAITNPTRILPFPMKLGITGYNISSVDQVYLPVAMEAITSPVGLIPYIGSVVSFKDFRTNLNNFVNTTEKGWPVYNVVDPLHPRVAATYNALQSYFGLISGLTPAVPGNSVANLVNLYRTCRGSTSTALCKTYQQVLTIIDANYQNYLTNFVNGGKKCGTAIPANQLEAQTILHLYGWVPFNSGCAAGDNSLATTPGVDFNTLLGVYTDTLQPNREFNPYVQFIHGPNPPNLSMAAYAFSVDDAISFQQYEGNGIIFAFAGTTGLDNPNQLDNRNRVTVTLGIAQNGIPQWSQFGLCSLTNSKPIDPNAPFVRFWPTYPCTVSVTDLKGKLVAGDIGLYQFTITQGPIFPNLNPLVVSCAGVTTNTAWCANVMSKGVTGPNDINTQPPNPDPPNSTHDFDGNGLSDIAWRDTSGNVAVWSMNGAQVLPAPLTGNVAALPTNWQIVGQRDFDGDGKADLLLRDNLGNTVIWFLYGSQILNRVIPCGSPSKSVTVKPQSLGLLDPKWTVVGTGNFGARTAGADILWRDTSGNLAEWQLNGATCNPFNATFNIGSVPLNWKVVGIGDFNGDGRSDILWRDDQGNTSIWYMNGQTPLPQSTGIGNVPTTWTVVGTGDFNHDGRSDILWRDSVGDLAIWLMGGGGTPINPQPPQILGTASFGGIPLTWSVAATGDYNFDGFSDILWRDTAGDVTMWFMTGTANTTSVLSSAAVGTLDPTVWTIQNLNAD
jgi:hypothetical protein